MTKRKKVSDLKVQYYSQTLSAFYSYLYEAEKLTCQFTIFILGFYLTKVSDVTVYTYLHLLPVVLGFLHITVVVYSFNLGCSWLRDKSEDVLGKSGVGTRNKYEKLRLVHRTGLALFLVFVSVTLVAVLLK